MNRLALPLSSLLLVTACLACSTEETTREVKKTEGPGEWEKFTLTPGESHTTLYGVTVTFARAGGKSAGPGTDGAGIWAFRFTSDGAEKTEGRTAERLFIEGVIGDHVYRITSGISDADAQVMIRFQPEAEPVDLDTIGWLKRVGEEFKMRNCSYSSMSSGRPENGVVTGTARQGDVPACRIAIGVYTNEILDFQHMPAPPL